MTAIVLIMIKLYLVACHFFFNVESTNIIGFVGIGYDLLKGNPEGDFNNGGIDPGYRLARNIFKRTYTQGKTGTFNGVTVKIPDQMEYQPLNGCSLKESVSIYDGTQSYQKKLDVNTEVEASGSYGLFEFRFSLSTGYSQMTESSVNEKKVLLDKIVVCSKGQIRYKMDSARHTDSRISDDFYYSVQSLPLTYDEGKYVQFIRNWGTHFIESATLGGRLTHRFESSYQNIFKFASENEKTSLSAGGSYSGYSGSFKVDIDKFSQSSLQTSSFASQKSTIHTGSNVVEVGNGWKVPTSDRTTPVPIKVTLKVITDAFREGVWSNLPGGTYDSLHISQKLEHLKTALHQYPALSNAPSSSDPSIIFPNAWPDGRYSLPQANTGCPASGGGEYRFTWREGYIYQDNEDDNNANGCPSPFSLSGQCDNAGLKLYYCTKTVTQNDCGIKWPKGFYCIGKKDSCPYGFSSGYINWDDEDDNNGNAYSAIGAIPNGNYDHNTRIDYCCRNDGGHPDERINLPTDKNFVLIRNHRAGCQQVNGMNVRLMEIKTDDEDDDNSNSVGGSYPYGAEGENIVVGYCYYYN